MRFYGGHAEERISRSPNFTKKKHHGIYQSQTLGTRAILTRI